MSDFLKLCVGGFFLLFLIVCAMDSAGCTQHHPGKKSTPQLNNPNNDPLVNEFNRQIEEKYGHNYR